jgi:hypothetical protein
MPSDSSNQGPYLMSQWLAGFRITLSPVLRQRYEKGFLQQKIRDPLPLNFPIGQPQQRGVFERLNALQGGSNYTPGDGGPQGSDVIDDRETDNTGSVPPAGPQTSWHSTATIGPGATETWTSESTNFTTGVPATQAPATTGGTVTPVGCGACAQDAEVESGFLGTGCPPFYGDGKLCGSDDTLVCPWTDYGSGPQCGPTDCDQNDIPEGRTGILEYEDCGDCPVYDWECCYDSPLAEFQTYHYFGCCCNTD